MRSKTSTTALAIAGVVMAVAVPAFAQPAATSATSSDNSARSGDTSRRVCRSLRPTGSRLATRVCRTQAQWDDIRKETQEFVQEGQQQGGSRNFDYDGPG